MAYFRVPVSAAAVVAASGIHARPRGSACGGSSVCVFWAWVLHLFWWFPQPTGMMAAGVIATATQLASPWMPPSRRRALSEMSEQTV